MDFLHRLRAWIRAADPAAGCGVRALNAGRPLSLRVFCASFGEKRDPAGTSLPARSETAGNGRIAPLPARHTTATG